MARKDWDKEFIKYQLKKKGFSLRQLSIESGLAPNTLSNVFRISYPKAEKIIASVLNVSANEIWPSRYKNSNKLLEDYRGKVK
ncbi:helix-turn-helix domain-containing protein [Orbaceae bacterium ac157xtp]